MLLSWLPDPRTQSVVGLAFETIPRHSQANRNAVGVPVSRNIAAKLPVDCRLAEVCAEAFVAFLPHWRAAALGPNEGKLLALQ